MPSQEMRREASGGRGAAYGLGVSAAAVTGLSEGPMLPGHPQTTQCHGSHSRWLEGFQGTEKNGDLTSVCVFLQPLRPSLQPASPTLRPWRNFPALCLDLVRKPLGLLAPLGFAPGAN